MLVVGIAFLVFAALVELVHMTIVGAAVLVGIGLVVLGLLMGERGVTVRS